MLRIKHLRMGAQKRIARVNFCRIWSIVCKCLAISFPKYYNSVNNSKRAQIKNHREETVMGETERLLLSLGMDSEHDGYKKAVAILRILIDGGDRAAE